MISMVEIIAGLGWEPEIRGLLTVVLSFAILGGSIWLLLVTNTGTRLGSLIALAGFWGWMFVMGIFWWIYGIGWVGSSPAWQVEDVFADPPGIEQEGIADAFLGNVNLLPEGNCFGDYHPFSGVNFSLDSTRIRRSTDADVPCTPRAVELLMAYPGPERELIARELLNPQTDDSKIDIIINDLFGAEMTEPASMLEGLSQSQRDQVFERVVQVRYSELAGGIVAGNEALGPDDARYLTGADLDARIKVATDAADIRFDDLSLSALQASGPVVIDWAVDEGLVRFGGWNLQTASQSGEAAATADAFLRDELFPDGNFVVLDAFQQGGKDKRTGTGMWDRISHKVSSTVQVTHPTNYTVVNVQQTLDKVPDPSLPPPVPEINPAEPTYSVVMVRNLGNLRLIPALFTIVSLILFLITCLILHWRDLGLREKGIEY